MKPRLRRAHLTNEDWEIWSLVDERGPKEPGTRLYGFVIDADRRDADLMLSREQWREQCPPAEAWCCDAAGCFWCSEDFPVGPPFPIEVRL